MDTTTIQITDSQKSQLDALKLVENEAYKSVMGRLLDNYMEDIDGKVFVTEAGEEIPVSEIVDGEADKIESQL